MKREYRRFLLTHFRTIYSSATTGGTSFENNFRFTFALNHCEIFYYLLKCQFYFCHLFIYLDHLHNDASSCFSDGIFTEVLKLSWQFQTTKPLLIFRMWRIVVVIILRKIYQLYGYWKLKTIICCVKLMLLLDYLLFFKTLLLCFSKNSNNKKFWY